MTGCVGRAMTSVLVDSNIFFDVMFGGVAWEWSAARLAELGATRQLAVNPVIWAEVGASFGAQAELDRSLEGLMLAKLPISFDVAFRAGQAHRAYRNAGGQRERTLPDFLVGAHGEVDRHAVLTRDPKRYRSYFPDLEIISPDTHP